MNPLYSYLEVFRGLIYGGSFAPGWMWGRDGDHLRSGVAGRRLDLFAIMATTGGAGVNRPAVDCREVTLVYPLVRDRPGSFKEQVIRSLPSPGGGG